MGYSKKIEKSMLVSTQKALKFSRQIIKLYVCPLFVQNDFFIENCMLHPSKSPITEMNSAQASGDF
jgi:hypothetical protein